MHFPAASSTPSTGRRSCPSTARFPTRPGSASTTGCTPGPSGTRRSACDVIVAVADAMTRQFLDRGIGRPEQYVTVRRAWRRSRFERRDGTVAGGRSLGSGWRPAISSSARSRGSPSTKGMTTCWMRSARNSVHAAAEAGVGGRRMVARAADGSSAGPGRWRCGVRWHECATAPPNAQVILTGPVPPAESPGSSVRWTCWRPSYREGLPRTVPQALLCGVCPVAYDCDGTGEVLGDGQTGRLVPLGDRAKLARRSCG